MGFAASEGYKQSGGSVASGAALCLVSKVHNDCFGDGDHYIYHSTFEEQWAAKILVQRTYEFSRCLVAHSEFEMRLFASSYAVSSAVVSSVVVVESSVGPVWEVHNFSMDLLRLVAFERGLSASAAYERGFVLAFREESSLYQV